MFVLDELDKLLDKFIFKKKNQARKLAISLADVTRFNVEQLPIAIDVDYPIRRVQDELAHRDQTLADFNLGAILSRQSHLTVNSLFALAMRSTILSRLIEIPVRPYASAKLLICDGESYHTMMKFQRVSDKLKQSKFTIYRKPSSVTAIFLLEDIVDVFDRIRRPLVIIKEDDGLTGRRGNFDYSIVKQVFPFLKMTDLTIILTGAGGLNLKIFNTDERREYQVLQFLSHFARSARLIDLQSINKQIGQQHPMYDNVCIFWPLDSNGESLRGAHLRPKLVHLSHMASQLILLAQRLNLHLQSITYRAGDPNGSTRIFSHIVESILRTKPAVASSDKLIPARVLVLDRYFDLQGPLYHSERYGPFFEQEIPAATSKGLLSKMRLNLIDDLDESLHLERLADALSAVLNYTVNLKQGASNHSRPDRTSGHLMSSFMPTSQSIRKHMDAIRLAFKFLNEGYLLILKLEACLRDILHRLRTLEEPLPADQQADTVSRIERAMESYNQMIRLSGSSIKPINLIRLACNFIDVINIFVYIHGKNSPRMNSCKSLLRIKTKILTESSFKDSILSRPESAKYDDELEEDYSLDRKLWNKLATYDNISKLSCESRSTLSCEHQIERFLCDSLDSESYPKILLAETPKKYTTLQIADEFILLVVLGSMSYDEVGRIKLLEKSLKDKKQTNSQSKLSQLILITCGIVKPTEFLLSM